MPDSASVPAPFSFDRSVQTENYRGEWVPAIPGPFLGLRKQCRCGRKFWTMEGYQGHYAYAHILGMVAPPLGVPKDDRGPINA